jgi:hypothetical protein
LSYVICADHLLQAIIYAVDKWDVDIISMSWGFDREVDEISAALKHASQKDKLLLAAASNCGGNSTPSWPSTYRSAMCIYASDGAGNKYAGSPTPRPNKHNFSTLGVAAKGWSRNSDTQRVLGSGTSSATAITAGIAASVLDIARCQKTEYLGQNPSPQDVIKYEQKLVNLGTWDGMAEVFSLMREGAEQKRDGYDYIAPWALLQREERPGDLVRKIMRAVP